MHDSLLTIILLGLLEGLTEFIPVSSTGHLILAERLLGAHGANSASFDIIIQLGAILAVLVFYADRFWNIIKGLFHRSPSAWHFTRNVFLGFLPALVIGALAYHGVKALLEKPMVVAVALWVGGIVMLVIERMQPPVESKTVQSIPPYKALLVGLAQCLAMIPGISRSGATIMGALCLGVDRKTATEYSFFLAIPVMLAATVKELWEQRHSLSSADLGEISLGFAISFFVALIVIKLFLEIVTRRGFGPFAWYRIIIGFAAMILLLIAP
ncbi:MAG: undecaprenyl-diphosphate phosphatase [Zymomonas mobilis subsp. pomaceae]|uniref:Undecaprenyl-diphosphatase n=1 Tax=Zymomonas mobilis subsp. pomaceae (strain ATCC 29192 / DSM 22645 / JCM 10191 / CCUG 17912 / NBRC 13757 / NCIMB 11200 / NRRL B-4491 / Barker I) TaxID=579138 RepID=F8ETS2_ZYMMT|nr:undecaprenyl-diphosphate phosphatase [Zymomonas mobilis]AEI37082.1 undecaprenol kinase [Zymomonas mobilis subsp. pomaceae ATCC 29192]MDX5948453.1 undecaprenyl-diphosphate phosphatase [Zymomonas mobilis subsp. pomaceae]GEB89483.1 undecaprenyl-diphosphatase [Zymomonas mobilis subsp. pomaceae]